MEKSSIIALLQKAVTAGPYVWADFGSGEGAFTAGLLDLLRPEAEIYSVDVNSSKIKYQQKLFVHNNNVHVILGNFNEPLSLPPLDGLLMANSLHFVKDQVAVLKNIQKYLKPGGKIVLVEYNTDAGNTYVPYPLSFESLKKLATDAKFSTPTLLANAPSSYWGSMYAAEINL